MASVTSTPNGYLFPVEFETGVYAIRNLVNGKVYVGSSAFSIRQRWGQHKSSLQRKTHRNRHLQGAWKKYGESAFEFTVLFRCPPDDCLAAEQRLIDKLRSADPSRGYNLRPFAANNLGHKHSMETRAKMSAVQRVASARPETRRKRSASLMGHVVTLATRAKVAAGHLGKYGMPGEKNSRAKLTEDQVEEIRRLYVPHSKEYGGGALARRMRVTSQMIINIVRGKAWKCCGDGVVRCIREVTDIRRKLTIEQTQEIVRRYKKSCRENGSVALAREFGIGSSQVLRIVHRA